MSGLAARTALALSLGLNILAVGLIGGAAVAWLRVEAAPRHALRNAGQHLQPADRRRYEAMLKDFGHSVRPLRQQAQDDRKAAAQLFAAPNFDAAAVTADLARARDADLTLRARLEARLVGFAATLSQDERVKLSIGLVHAGPLRQPPPNQKR